MITTTPVTGDAPDVAAEDDANNNVGRSGVTPASSPLSSQQHSLDDSPAKFSVSSNRGLSG